MVNEQPLNTTQENLDMEKNNQVMTVTLQNRDHIIFEGKVKAITSTNAKGTFDILAEHSNFITILNEYVILHLPDGTGKKISCHEGVLWITKNIVRIIVDILPEQKPKKRF